VLCCEGESGNWLARSQQPRHRSSEGEIRNGRWLKLARAETAPSTAPSQTASANSSRSASGCASSIVAHTKYVPLLPYRGTAVSPALLFGADICRPHRFSTRHPYDLERVRRPRRCCPLRPSGPRPSLSHQGPKPAAQHHSPARFREGSTRLCLTANDPASHQNLFARSFLSERRLRRCKNAVESRRSFALNPSNA
jgi:hypothetical protein